MSAGNGCSAILVRAHMLSHAVCVSTQCGHPVELKRDGSETACSGLLQVYRL